MAIRRSIAGIIIGWLITFVALGGAIFLYHGSRLSREVGGFPRMPLYGAVTWWFFFFVIPMIGLTYGALNEWKRRDTTRR